LHLCKLLHSSDHVTKTTNTYQGRTFSSKEIGRRLHSRLTWKMHKLAYYTNNIDNAWAGMKQLNQYANHIRASMFPWEDQGHTFDGNKYTMSQLQYSMPRKYFKLHKSFISNSLAKKTFAFIPPPHHFLTIQYHLHTQYCQYNIVYIHNKSRCLYLRRILDKKCKINSTLFINKSLHNSGKPLNPRSRRLFQTVQR